LLYLRVAAAAALVLSLASCSFFGFWSEPEAPKLDQHSTARPLEGTQLAALPGYQSDQDVAPGRIEAIRGFVGYPPRRPARVTAAVPAPPIKRRLTFQDLLPRQQVLDLQPIPASVEPGSHSLADLVADRDWRKRTSEKLSRLFQ
jgi:hypothetical protein